MILIAHRGNIDGPNPDNENRPGYVATALEQGYDVEVDVWIKDGALWLGHDKPTWKMNGPVGTIANPFYLLSRNNVWCHAKNLEALDFLIQSNFHVFWHQKDDFTLTNRGYIWTYPGKPLIGNSVAVMFDDRLPSNSCFAVCSDYVGRFK